MSNDWKERLGVVFSTNPDFNYTTEEDGEEFCSVCDYTTFKEIAATGHSYTYAKGTAPTTSKTGTLKGTCSACSGTTTVTLPKLNKTDYTYKVTKAATCTATGTGRYTWNTTTYGTFYYEVSIAKIAHSYKSVVTAPTCTAAGYTTHTCSACGDSYTDSEVDALGHDMREDINEPGPGYEGYTYHFCSRCDYSYKDNFVDALPEVTTEDIQKAIIKYINQYRAEQGSTQLTYLPGMTNVAKYRSKQLTTNFAHDTSDIREALAYYQYGEYIDMTEYGGDPEQNHYSASTQEAIAYATYGGSADEIGQSFARGFQKSSGHWRYVGSSENSYIGVGVTKSGGLWYVCVMVGSVNYG